tara:strand:+ start:3321 stop:3584 length:264 start_codon:yes stop_codon:yes gene_type:complete
MSKEISKKDFIAEIKDGKKPFLRKPRSWQKCYFWMESKRDPWFVNKAFTKRVKGNISTQKSTWITTKEISEHFDYYVSLGYKAYSHE